MPQFWVWMHYCHPTSHWTVYSASLFLPENLKLLHILIQLMWIQSSQEWNPERQHIISSHHQQELQTEAEQWELWGRTFNFKYIKNHWQAEPTERAPQTKCFSFCCSWSRTSECCVTHLYLSTSVQLPSWPAAVIISLWSYYYITSVVAGWD